MDSNIWWSGPVVLIVLRLLYAEAVFGRAQDTGGALRFSAAAGVRIALGTGITGIVVASIVSAGREESWVIVGATALMLFLCFMWPTTITLNNSDLRQHSWWRRTVRIGWTDVTGIERRAGGELSVFGRNGETIAFSRYHVDPRRFEAEVLKRANLEGVIDASRPPTMRRP